MPVTVEANPAPGGEANRAPGGEKTIREYYFGGDGPHFGTRNSSLALITFREVRAKARARVRVSVSVRVRDSVRVRVRVNLRATQRWFC